jgi:hypothetical protein
MARLSNELARDRFDFDKAQRLAEFNYQKAKDQFDAETTIALAEYNGLINIAKSDTRLDPLTKGLISGMFIYEERALETPNDKNIESFERARKLLEHTLVQNYGYEIKLPKVEFKRNWRPGLHWPVIGGKQLQTTEPPIIKTPRRQTELPQYTGPRSITGTTQQTTAKPPLYAGQSIDMREKPSKTSAEVFDYVQRLYNAGITPPFSKEEKDSIKKRGFDPDTIEKEIKLFTEPSY